MPKAPVKKPAKDKDAKQQKPLPEKPQPKLGPISSVVMSILIFFSAQIMAAIGFGLYIAAKGLSQEQAEALLTDSTLGQFSFFVASGVLTVLLLWLYLKNRKISWTDIGLNKPKSSNFLLAIATFGAYFVTLSIIIVIVSQFIPAVNVDQQQEIGFQGASGQLALSLVFISLVIVPAVSEEILVRGFLYGGLVKKFSKITAALLASAIFGFAHLQLGSGNDPVVVAAIDTFVLSMFLIWLREKTGNIYAGMLVHAMKNSVAFAALFLLK